MEKHYRLLYPARVCLITSRHGGKDNVMSASWVFPLSADPAMFGVAVATKRYSYGLIKGGEAFGINIPGPELEAAARLCGTESGKEKDKFALAGLTKEEGMNVPLIKECSASIECELVDEFHTGDHMILVGKAVKIIKRKESKGIYQSQDGFIPV
ncbi:MAG: flavin reductase family protein [Candidatus Micrarchaeota archaeon]